VTAAPARWSHKILQAFKLAENASSEELIQNHIIPAWKSKKAHTWSTLCKEQLASFILTRFSLLSPETLVELRAIPMIPASQLNGLKTSKFTRAASLIDPSVSELRDLCFDDEGIVPEITFLGNFKTALIGCGLKTAVDEEVVYNRIRCYASTNNPLQEIQKRAQNLLNSFCRWTSPSVNQAGSDLQRLLWLPVMDHSGTLSLKAAQQCRSSNYRLLVGSHLAILEMSISTEWEVRMGWHETLSADILLSQLNAGVQAKDRNIVDAVLRYISKNSLEETLLHELVDIPCVLTTHGSFVIPSQTFRPPISYIIGGCDGLQPYLANVDRNFWRDHTDLLVKLGVGDKLQPSDLLKVQEILEAKPSLDVPDIKVAVELVNLASEFPRTELTSLKVISESGVLYPIQDISYGDLGPLKSKGTVVLTHPDIPRKTILLLGISSLRERLVKGMLEIEDVDDEDEFDQREKVTTRIADTLDRYSVEATFREYLANAEDTEGASSISWLLDEREHPNQKLLTTEMEMLQGPALLVHNDGGKLSLTYGVCWLTDIPSV
jgi:sacsin